MILTSSSQVTILIDWIFQLFLDWNVVLRVKVREEKEKQHSVRQIEPNAPFGKAAVGMEEQLDRVEDH